MENYWKDRVSNECVANETVVSEISENTQAKLDTIVEDTESESVEQENSLEIETMTDNLNVTINNFDELQFEKEEKDYFDHEQDQDFIVNSSESNINNRYDQDAEAIDII